MASSRDSSDPSGSKETLTALGKFQELEPRVARRRLSQARHRATLIGLFNHLRKTICSHSDLTASKWQVLNKAKNHIQELEQTLDNLLKLKESYNLKDGNACSLEEAKEEYANLYARNLSLVSNEILPNDSTPWHTVEALGKDAREEEEEEDEEEEEEDKVVEEERKILPLLENQIMSPDILEFERYLNFYKQTMDLLTKSGIISLQDAALPLVSAAISHLWQNLSEERKTILWQAWLQDTSPPGPSVIYSNGSVHDSGVDSQGGSCSLFSTPEEMLFEDALDVAHFLDKSEAPSPLIPSWQLTSGESDTLEEKFQLYKQIVDFFKGLCSINTEIKEEEIELPVNDETMLRCLETFDDEDL